MMLYNITQIRNIKVDDILLINDIAYTCTMASGYLNNPKMAFRFTNMKLPKFKRHTIYNEFYYKCTDLLATIKSNEVRFLFTGNKNIKPTQLTLFT